MLRALYVAALLVTPLLASCGGASAAGTARIFGCVDDGGSAPTTRGAPTPPPPSAQWARAEGDRIVVERIFDHVCCLEGEAEAIAAPEGLTVQVELSGEPCRCRCQSTVVATSAPLSPGEHTVRVVVDGQEVAQTQVMISLERSDPAPESLIR